MGNEQRASRLVVHFFCSSGLVTTERNGLNGEPIRGYLRDMKSPMHGLRKLVAALGVGGLLTFVGCGSDDDDTAKVAAVTPLDPSTTNYGKTYAEWANAWWQWFYERQMPDASTCIDPLSDPTGEQCGYWQDPRSPVFFLAGNSSGQVVRTKCVVPAGKALFFPVFNYASDNGGVPPDKTLTDKQLQEGVQAGIDTIDSKTLVVELDGQSVPALDRYEVDATQFSYTVPPGPNLYGCLGVPFSGKVDPAFQGGYYILLPPPAAGQHTLHFGGTANQQTPTVIDVTYRLTVQ